MKAWWRACGGVLIAGTVALVAGCEKNASTSPTAVVAPASAPSMRSTAPDTSAPGSTGVRPASDAVGSAAPDPQATARDRGRLDAAGAMTKEEESKSMPQGGQANNYNAPNDTTRTPTPPAKE